MEYNIHHINDSKDLKVYERYLANDTQCQQPEVRNDCSYFGGYLKGCIGKLVRVESLIGNRLERRVGVLINVGCDYIVLKTSANCTSLVIEGSCVKYVTVLHNGTLLRS